MQETAAPSFQQRIATGAHNLKEQFLRPDSAFNRGIAEKVFRLENHVKILARRDIEKAGGKKMTHGEWVDTRTRQLMDTYDTIASFTTHEGTKVDTGIAIAAGVASSVERVYTHALLQLTNEQKGQPDAKLISEHEVKERVKRIDNQGALAVLSVGLGNIFSNQKMPSPSSSVGAWLYDGSHLDMNKLSKSEGAQLADAIIMAKSIDHFEELVGHPVVQRLDVHAQQTAPAV